MPSAQPTEAVLPTTSKPMQLCALQSKSYASVAMSAKTVLSAIKAAGYEDAQVIEIVLHVAGTNYITRSPRLISTSPSLLPEGELTRVPHLPSARLGRCRRAAPGTCNKDFAMSRPPLPQSRGRATASECVNGLA